MAIDPQEFAQLHANALKYVGSQKKPPKGRSGLAKFLPAIGATVAGVAAAPFTGGLSLAGTLAALGAAGAVGSAAGEFGAEKVSHEKFNLGNIAKEATLGGALSAIPLGGLGRAAKTAAGVEAQGARSILKTPTLYGKAAGATRTSGVRLESRAGGYGLGTKLSDGTRITPTKVQQFKALDKAEKIPQGHPGDQATVIEKRLTDANSQLDNAINIHNRRLVVGENTKLRNTLNSQISQNTAIKGNTQAQKRLVELNRSWRNITTVKGAVKAKRDLQELINHGRNSASATPVIEQVNSQALRTLNKFINSKGVAPQIGEANKRVSGLINRQDLVLAESSNLTKQSTNAGGSITGRLITGDTAQAGKSRVGNALQKLPAGNTAVGQVAGLGAREATKQTLGRAIGTGLVPGLQATPPPLPQEDPSVDNLINMPGAVGPYDSNLGGVVSADPTQVDPMQTDQLTQDPTMQGQDIQGPVTLQDALMQAQSILGTDQTPATYLSYAKAIQAATKADKPNANQQKTSMALQNARNVVDELTQAYQAVGGPQGAGTGQVRNALGKVRIDQQARNYNDLRQAFLSRIARAFGEVGTLNEGDINRALGAIPDLADNQQTAARKLAILNNLLAKAQQNNTGGASGLDLTEALSQLPGAY